MNRDENPAGGYVCICRHSFPTEMALEDHAREPRTVGGTRADGMRSLRSG